MQGAKNNQANLLQIDEQGNFYGDALRNKHFNLSNFVKVKKTGNDFTGQEKKAKGTPRGGLSSYVDSSHSRASPKGKNASINNSKLDNKSFNMRVHPV